MRQFTYATVCSGIECCTVALEAAAPTKGRWKAIFFSEIDKFPSALLAERYPGVPNLGDMQKIHCKDGVITNGETEIRFDGQLDLLAGGTPCQDVSVAGSRAGAEEGSGTRSALCWEYLRLIRELRPRCVLWENVTGVLSAGGAEPSAGSWPKFQSSGIALGGEYWTRNSREWTAGPWPSRSDAGVCGLSALLALTYSVPEKYYLSPAACAGLMRRCATRGKPLPDILRETLERQSHSESGADARGGGKGALVGDNIAHTLACNNDQALFVQEHVYTNDRTRVSNVDVASSLFASDNKDGQVILRTGGAVQAFANHPQDSRVEGPIDVASTLARKAGTGGGNTDLVIDRGGGRV